MNGITLTEVKQNDARRGREIAWVGFAPPENDTQHLGSVGLRDLFIHLWTRLNEASLHARGLQKKCEQFDRDVAVAAGNLAKLTDVDDVYGEMMRLLDDETSKIGAREDRLATMPELASALVIVPHAQQQVGELSITDMMHMLQKQSEAVNAGDLGHAEATLAAQASALNTLFGALSQRAAMNMGKNMEAMEMYLKLAMRAQNQCRATIETLATIKNPPVVFAKQANIAHGHQQVNNGTAVPISQARGVERPHTRLLEAEHGERLDTGAARTSGRSHSAVATVAIVDRPKNRRRQGARQS